MLLVGLFRKRHTRDVPSEIERIAAAAEQMTIVELDKFIHSRFEKDLQSFKRLVSEQKERLDWARTEAPVQPLVKKAQSFYDDLLVDGYIKRDLSLFKGDKLADYKVGQARDEAHNLLKELQRAKKMHYKDIFRKWNKVYTINYETLISSYFVKLAQKISGRSITNKARVLGILSSYRNGKHAKLFRSLIPHIRNSIQHQDFIIDPKEPKITFYDRKKNPLVLTNEEYTDICWELFFLTIAFDIVDFDLKSGILDILIEAVDIVDGYLTSRDLKLVRAPKGEPSLSLLDWAVLIKSGKGP